MFQFVLWYAAVLASRLEVHASNAVYWGVCSSGPCAHCGAYQLFVTRFQVCGDLDLVEFRVLLLFPVVEFLIEERNQFVYLLLLLGFLTLGISYLSVSWVLLVLVWISKFPCHKPF